MDWRGPFDKFVENMQGAPWGLQSSVVEVGDTFAAAMKCIEQATGKPARPEDAVRLTALMMADVYRRRDASERRAGRDPDAD